MRWPMQRLGDLCQIQLGKTPPRGQARYWDKERETDNVWLSIADLVHGQEVSDSKEYITDLAANGINATPAGTLLLSFKLTIGRVSFAGCDLYTNEAIASLLNLTPLLDKYFLFYYFSAFDWDVLTEGDIKLKGKTLNKAKLKELPVPLPPLPEQQRIISKLDAAFTALGEAEANVERNRANARELFESYLNGVFEGKEGWERTTVGGLGETRTGSTPPTIDQSNYGDFAPFVKPGDFNVDGTIAFRNDGVSEAGFALSRPIPANSILMVCVGATIGKTGFVDRVVTSNQQINSVTPRSEFFAKFFYYAMTTRRFFDAVVQHSSQATLPIISKSKWECLPLSYPKDRGQQQRVADELDALSIETKQLESTYRQKLVELTALKKGLLGAAFRGEL